jgi:putative membrane protein
MKHLLIKGFARKKALLLFGAPFLFSSFAPVFVAPGQFSKPAAPNFADTDFITTASHANMAAIFAGQLAARKAGRADIRSFADSMVADHSMAQGELDSISFVENVRDARAPDTEHQQAIARLQSLSGAAFDAAYLKMQSLDHAVAIQLFQQESGLGRDSLCRMYAKKYLPRIRHHVMMIRKLRR